MWRRYSVSFAALIGMEVTSLQPLSCNTALKVSKTFVWVKAGVSGGSKPHQRCLSALVWKTDHRHSVWAQAVPLLWRQEKSSPHHSHSQVCVLQGCLKIDICESWKSFPACIRLVITYVAVHFVSYLPLPSNAPLHELECRGEAGGRIQHCHKQISLLLEVNSLLKKSQYIKIWIPLSLLL